MVRDYDAISNSQNGSVNSKSKGSSEVANETVTYISMYNEKVWMISAHTCGLQ